MKRAIAAVVFVFLFSGIAFAGVNEVNVLDSGAKPDGTTDCTKAFQAALDQAGKSARARPRGHTQAPSPSRKVRARELVAKDLSLHDKGRTLIVYADGEWRPHVHHHARRFCPRRRVHSLLSRTAYADVRLFLDHPAELRCSMITSPSPTPITASTAAPSVPADSTSPISAWPRRRGVYVGLCATSAARERPYPPGELGLRRRKG